MPQSGSLPDGADLHPLVSVIIVTWNGIKWLERCLDSVQAQTYPQLETIVVDNGSTDGTVAYLEESYPNVRVVASSENLGFAAGNNLGIKAARGQEIVLLNSDTWLEPDAIARLVEERRRRGLDVIGPREGDYWTGEARERYTAQIDPWGYPVFREVRNSGRRSFYISGVCLLFPADLYRATDGLDSAYFMYCEEVDWFWRLLLLGKEFDYSHDVVVYHAGMGSGGAGIDRQRFLWRNQNTLMMLLTNYELRTLAWVLPTFAMGCLVEALAFFAVGRRDVAATYPQGWWLAARELRETLRKRRRVQSLRTVSDGQLRSRMYLGFGKLRHLVEFAGERRRS